MTTFFDPQIPQRTQIIRRISLKLYPLRSLRIALPRFRDVEQRVLFTHRFPDGAQADCSCDYGVDDLSQFSMVGPTRSARMDHFPPSIFEKKPYITPGEERLLYVRQIDSICEAARRGNAVKLNS